jgi:hypothetical protein
MGGDVFLQACNRRDIKAHAVLFQYLTKGARFRFLADKEFFDPCVYAAVLDTSGLGAGQNVAYGRRVALGVAAPERFHSGVDLSFMTRRNGRGVDFCSW